MRLLAGLGALFFAYLALIPAGLVYSTLESACAGGSCETSLLSKVGFTILYSVCLAAVLGTAGLFAAYAVTGRVEPLGRLPPALAVTAAVIGTAVFVLFFVAFPLGGGVALAAAALGYTGVRLRMRGEGGRRGGDGGGGGSPERLAPIDPQPSSNGHSTNGHEALRERR